jgi:hypothetical protein
VRACSQDLAQFGDHVVMAAVRAHVQAEPLEPAGVDVVNEESRRPLARDEQEGAASRMRLRLLAVCRQQSLEGGVRAAEVVHEPAISRQALELVANPPRAPGEEQVGARRCRHLLTLPRAVGCKFSHVNV